MTIHSSTFVSEIPWTEAHSGLPWGGSQKSQRPSDSVQFSHSVGSNSLWPHGLQHNKASLSITNSWSLLKLMSIESVMPSNHLIFCCALLLLPSIVPSIRVFSYESVLSIRWPKYWSFSFNISPFNEYSGLILNQGIMWASKYYFLHTRIKGEARKPTIF